MEGKLYSKGTGEIHKTQGLADSQASERSRTKTWKAMGNTDSVPSLFLPLLSLSTAHLFLFFLQTIFLWLLPHCLSSLHLFSIHKEKVTGCLWVQTPDSWEWESNWLIMGLPCCIEQRQGLVSTTQTWISRVLKAWEAPWAKKISREVSAVWDRDSTATAHWEDSVSYKVLH